MSTKASSSYGSSSIRASRSGFSASGSQRPSRPGQLDQAIVDHLSGGMDPQQVSEISHVSAASLLNRVHRTQDPAIVQRVLTLVDREGIDIIAELWSDADADSLPGILWRLYTLRSWMRRDSAVISELWALGEPVDTAASAIVGVDRPLIANDIANTADSILSGAFQGDFAVALERAGAFCEVISLGIRTQCRRRQKASADAIGSPSRSALATQLVRSLHSAQALHTTGRDFIHGAHLWRQDSLE
ncbi:thymidine phosphorylase [Bifidobacterium fermentum]|uniref:Thymidine phosphorylase n=1 Tax=Bifidobacterium fermentum TaxID=3059035 RepID=A0AB39UIL9_9BIFI